jgi:hypothetical protein
VFGASDKASAMTGTVVNLSGGTIVEWGIHDAHHTGPAARCSAVVQLSATCRLGHPFHVVDDDTVVLPVDHPFVKEGRFAPVMTPGSTPFSPAHYRK